MNICQLNLLWVQFKRAHFSKFYSCNEVKSSLPNFLHTCMTFGSIVIVRQVCQSLAVLWAAEVGKHFYRFLL